MKPDSWRVTSRNFCGTHTIDEEVANYWVKKGNCYPLFRLPKLPKAVGVAIDAESPGRAGVLVMFDRELTSEELRNLHLLLESNY